MSQILRATLCPVIVQVRKETEGRCGETGPNNEEAVPVWALSSLAEAR